MLFDNLHVPQWKIAFFSPKFHAQSRETNGMIAAIPLRDAVCYLLTTLRLFIKQENRHSSPFVSLLYFAERIRRLDNLSSVNVSDFLSVRFHLKETAKRMYV